MQTEDHFVLTDAARRFLADHPTPAPTEPNLRRLRVANPPRYSGRAAERRLTGER